MAQSKIATAYVQVMPSMEGVAPKVKSFFGGSGKDAGGAFGSSLISTIKSAIAAAGIGKALKESITAGAELEQSLGGIETLFKENADLVIRNAQQAYKTAGLSANGYMETVTSFSASLLQGLSGDTEKAAAVEDMALTDMSDNANKMGSTMESIQNAYQGFAKQNYTMLDNLKLGYGGTKTEMQRLLSDAQKLTGVKYDISNLADVYSAIHVIQEGLGVTGTTALEASTTLTGSFNAMKASFTDVLGNLALGNDIQPSLNALAETTTTFLSGNLVPAVWNIITAMPGAISTFLNAMIPGNVGEVVTNAVNKFSAFVSENLPTVLESGGTTLLSFAEGIAGAIPSLFSTATNMVGTLGQFIINNPDKILSAAGSLFGNFLLGLAEAIPQLLVTAIDIVGALGSYLVENKGEIASSALEIGVQIVNAVWSGIQSVWDSLVSNFGGLVSKLAPTVTSNFGSFGSSLPAGLVFGSHAKGLDYVPFDGYIAELHKGEMVLTSKQADAVRSGAINSRNVTVKQYIYSQAKSAADLMEEARYEQEKVVWLGV